MMTVSGGATSLIGDLGEAAGLDFPPIAEATNVQIQKILGVERAFGNPLDTVGLPRLRRDGNISADDADDAVAGNAGGTADNTASSTNDGTSAATISTGPASATNSASTTIGQDNSGGASSTQGVTQDDIDIDHGASYGKTLFWDPSAPVPPYERLANVQFDIDAEKFYKIYMDLMTRQPGKR